MDPRIERLQRRSVAQPGVLSLGGGLPAIETFPVASLVEAFEHAGAEALQYDWPEGRSRLREWIARRLVQRGANVTPDDVLVTSGAQQALDLATQVLTQPGDAVRVPRACYPAALELFRSRGLTLVTEGPAPLSYAMPSVANPTGLALTASERASLLDEEGVVLEDDAYAEVRFRGVAERPLLATAPERVAYVGTFSKTLCPGLRCGWLIVPAQHRDAARRAKQLADLQANSLAQCVLERFLDETDFDRHLEGLRSFYAPRADALMDAVRRLLPDFRFREPEGGFSVWLTSERPENDVDLLARALTYGVSFDPGSDFRPDAARTPLAFRLSFSSLPPESMDEAVRRLVRAMGSHARAA